MWRLFIYPNKGHPWIPGARGIKRLTFLISMIQESTWNRKIYYFSDRFTLWRLVELDARHFFVMSLCRLNAMMSWKPVQNLYGVRWQMFHVFWIVVFFTLATGAWWTKRELWSVFFSNILVNKPQSQTDAPTRTHANVRCARIRNAKTVFLSSGCKPDEEFKSWHVSQ